MRATVARAHEDAKDRIDDEYTGWSEFRQGAVDHQFVDDISQRQALGLFVIIGALYLYFVRGTNRPPWGA